MMTMVAESETEQGALGPKLNRDLCLCMMPKHSSGLGSDDDRKGAHGSDFVVSVLVPNELSPSIGQMSQVIVVIGVKKSQYMTYSCTVPSAKSSFPWTTPPPPPSSPSSSSPSSMESIPL